MWECVCVNDQSVCHVPWFSNGYRVLGILMRSWVFIQLQRSDIVRLWFGYIDCPYIDMNNLLYFIFIQKPTHEKMATNVYILEILLNCHLDRQSKFTKFQEKFKAVCKSIVQSLSRTILHHHYNDEIVPNTNSIFELHVASPIQFKTI